MKKMVFAFLLLLLLLAAAGCGRISGSGRGALRQLNAALSAGARIKSGVLTCVTSVKTDSRTLGGTQSTWRLTFCRSGSTVIYRLEQKNSDGRLVYSAYSDGKTLYIKPEFAGQAAWLKKAAAPKTTASAPILQDFLKPQENGRAASCTASRNASGAAVYLVAGDARNIQKLSGYSDYARVLSASRRYTMGSGGVPTSLETEESSRYDAGGNRIRIQQKSVYTLSDINRVRSVPRPKG